MNEFLRTIGLADNLRLELPIKRSDFEDALNESIDPPGWNPFEAFSRSRKNYKGTVSYDKFELKKKRKIFDSNLTVKSKGTYTQVGSKLIVEIDLSGLPIVVIPVFLFVVVFYLIVIIFFVLGSEEQTTLWGIPFFIFHAFIMIGVPYFMLRRRVQQSKDNLERDIYFMLKDKLNQASR